MLSAGTRLGPYEVLSRIGAGGMGEVYRARDTRLDRDVAVKVLPPEMTGNADRLRRFEREARAAGALNHPNLTAVFDVGRADGGPYIVSELLDGESLRARISGTGLTVGMAVDYAVQIAQGLAAAHDKGIVHRDLKPANVFVTRDGRVKILDFGLAKLVEDETASARGSQTHTAPTGAGAMLGTAGYMSPEQVQGRPADHRSDIFALGAVLHEMLTGRPAFGGSTVEALHAILKEDPEDASIRRGVTPALAAVVRRCLAKSPEDRFQSARDLAYALQAVGPQGSAAPRDRRANWRVPLASAAAVGVLAALVAYVQSRRHTPSAARPPITSLAVLPLRNLSGDPEQEYFAEGMTEALITDLSKIRALKVISRTSVMLYKTPTRPVPQIARELGVEGVIEGSVQRSGDRVVITAQLIRATDDTHLWAERYERDLRDVLRLQSEVAQTIAREVQVAVEPDESRRLARSRTVDRDAYEAYLKGRYWWNKRTEEGYATARKHFQQAVEKDPGYALAYAGLADSYSTPAVKRLVPPGEAYAKAREAAARALAIDDTSAEAHTSLAYIKTFGDWDWLGAETEFRRAIELSPGYAFAHHWYSALLGFVRRHDEAIAEARRARELDPLSLIINRDLGVALYLARHYDAAIAQLRKTLEIDASFAPAHVSLGAAYAEKGNHRDAVAETEKAVALSPDAVSMALLARAHALGGRRPEALKVLDALADRSVHNYVSPFEFAMVHASLGDKEKALMWLDKAYEERSAGLGYISDHPAFDPLRQDPRFRDLLRRMSLPQ
jgi:eukaryotic-like serine/threonine-protein kinase